MAASFTIKVVIDDAAVWTRHREPPVVPSKWDKDDIVIEFDCCDYPVKVGRLTEEDKRVGFVLFSHLPTQCPCACKHVRNYARKPRYLLNPSPVRKLNEDAIQWVYKKPTLPPYNITIYLDNYFV